MTDHDSRPAAGSDGRRDGVSFDRRRYLQTLAALGAAGVGSSAAVPAATAQESPELGDYHQALRDDLTGRGGNRTLPAGEYVYRTTEEAALEAFSLEGPGRTSTISVDVDAVPLTTAERLEIPGFSRRPSDVTYRGAIEDHSFEAGDLLLGVAWVRSDSEEAEAKAAFRYEYTDADGDAAYTDSFVQRGAEIDPTDEWMRYFFPVEVGEIPDGSDPTPFLEFWTGYGRQTVEFGGMALIDYSDADVDLGTLPPYDYEGRSPDAEWRDAAQERIEEYRKTDVEVEVLGPGGQPMHGASVEVEMQEHAFDFGSAVSVGHINGEDEVDETYRETFLENFNKAVIENGLKYPSFLGPWGDSKEGAREALRWLNDNEIPTRGHYLLWEEYGTDGGGGMAIEDPDSMSAEEITQLITERITNHASDIGDMVTDWDMHNHPIWQSNFRDDPDLGWEAVDRWWEAADEATDQGLYTNEMGAIGGAWQRSQYLDFVERLVENDYPLDGIGFMGHHQQQWNQMLPITGDRSMEEGFDAFAEFGVPLLITEFDIEIFDRRNAQDVAVQADYTRDFLTMAFSKEPVEGVISWGFWAGDHWRPTGAYFDEDWTLRENGEVYMDLVFDEWWTEERGWTDEDGVFSTRGFEGEYRVSARKGALYGETTATFDDDAGTVTVELTPPGKDDSKDESDEKPGKKPGKGPKNGSDGPWGDDPDDSPWGDEWGNDSDDGPWNDSDGGPWGNDSDGPWGKPHGNRTDGKRGGSGNGSDGPWWRDD